jgi:hypothetical protein
LREVSPVPRFAEEILREFEEPPAACVAAADFLLEELERHDPDLDERCGLLADRHELYALRMPCCGRHMLIVSLDTARRRPWPCTVHGLLSSRVRPCEAGRARATRHLDLIDPSWEAGNG